VILLPLVCFFHEFLKVPSLLWGFNLFQLKKLGKCKAIPLQAWTDPWGFREVEVPRFQDNQHMKVVRLSALLTDCLYPLQIPVTLSGIKPTTFRLVAQCLTQLRHCIPQLKKLSYFPAHKTHFFPPKKCYLNSTCILCMRSGITACERLTFLSGDLPTRIHCIM
jgi:hypothetical protein